MGLNEDGTPRNASDVWDQMQEIANAIDASGTDYDAYDPNSNSTVRTILEDSGIDINNVLPAIEGIDASGFSGWLAEDQPYPGFEDIIDLDNPQAAPEEGEGTYDPDGPLFGDDGYFGPNGPLFGNGGLFNSGDGSDGGGSGGGSGGGGSGGGSGGGGSGGGSGGGGSGGGSGGWGWPSLPGWLDPNSPFWNPPIDPLVLDLDGNGLDVIGLDEGTTHFDFGGDGFAEKTAWIGPNDAFLVHDLNQNGQVDNLAEMFGGQEVDGFAMLTLHDGNNDGIIDSQDVIYSELKLWQDANSDGITDAGELTSLSSHGITAINLDPEFIDHQVGGNWLSHESEYTDANGTGSIYDIWFENDQVQTIFAYGDMLTHADNIRILPNLVGYGTLKSLHAAMADDDSLRLDVETFVRNATSKNYLELANEIETILLKWAGTDDIILGSRGSHIDAQHITLLEALHGQDYLNVAGFSPTTRAGTGLEAYYDDTISSLTLRMLTQLPLSAIQVWNADGQIAPLELPAASMLLTYFNSSTDKMYGNYEDLFEVLAVKVASATNSEENIGALTDATTLIGMIGAEVVPPNGQTVAEFALDVFEVNGVSAGVRAVLSGMLSAETSSFGTDGNDVLNGSDGADFIYGALGDDTLSGSKGSDTYYYSSGDGNDYIDDEDASTASIDRLVFRDINPDGVRVSIVSGNDLLITIIATGETIRLDEQFYSSTSGYGIEEIVFADATVWDRSIIRVKAVEHAQTDGDDIINGTKSDDVFEGGLGDDNLYGSHGSDTYYYSSGDGDDYIDDEDASTAPIDRLVFRDVNPDAVRLSIVGGNDLLVTIIATGETIRLDEQFYSSTSGYGIEEIVFADTTVWDRSVIRVKVIEHSQTDGDDIINGTKSDDVFEGGLGDDNLYGSHGSDTYYYSSGDGDDYIDDEDGSTTSIDRLVFRDINPDDVRLSIVGGNDLLITIIATGETIRLDEQFYSAATGYGFEEIVFADGTVWLRADFPQIVVDHSPDGDVIFGTTGDDNLTGTDDNDTFNAGLGDDHIDSRIGSDTFIYASGDGNDYIDEENGSTVSIDTLKFIDINPDGITLRRSGVDLFIKINATGEEIEIDEQYYSATSNWGIERIEFADGTIWDRDTIESNIKILGTDGNDNLFGTDVDNLFIGGLGDDNIDSRKGSDTFIYASGDGNDYINEEDGSTVSIDVLKLIDINSDGVTLRRSGVDLFIKINATGEEIEIDEQFYSATNNWGIEQIQFADGVIWDRVDIQDKAWLRGTSGNDTMTGYNGDDVFYAGLGDDSIVSQVGSDTFIYASGDGNDYIDEENGSTISIDVLKFTDINPDDITLRRSGVDLFIKIKATGEEIEIDEQFYSATSNWGIEQIQFADGTMWTRPQILAQIIYGTSSDDILNGTTGNDFMRGFAGDDSLSGEEGNDNLMGGDGNDAFIFKANLGNDIISDFQGGAGAGDVIELQGIGISSYAQLQALMSEWNGATHIDFDANNSITLEGVTMASLDADDFSFA